MYSAKISLKSIIRQRENVLSRRIIQQKNHLFFQRDTLRNDSCHNKTLSIIKTKNCHHRQIDVRPFSTTTFARAQEETSFSKENTDPISHKILEVALEFVPKHGWTVEALSKSAESLGYLSVTHGMFPHGGVDLIDFFLEESRQQMTIEIKDKMNGLRVPQKIRLACVTRLNLTKPLIHRWPEALAILAQPNNVGLSAKHLAKLSDEIWFLAGDKSANMNWYTKRGELALIYAATELYMTQDKSPEYQATFEFLDRRLQEIAFLGKTISEVNAFVKFVGQSISGVLASKNIDITNMVDITLSSYHRYHNNHNNDTVNNNQRQRLSSKVSINYNNSNNFGQQLSINEHTPTTNNPLITASDNKIHNTSNFHTIERQEAILDSSNNNNSISVNAKDDQENSILQSTPPPPQVSIKQASQVIIDSRGETDVERYELISGVSENDQLSSDEFFEDDSSELSGNEEFQSPDDDDKCILDQSIITEEEKKVNAEFFSGKAAKTPERYMRIRNHILNAWINGKPNYVTKTSIRAGLKDCGDVNAIGRVHSYLEEIGAINVGEVTPKARRPYQRRKYEEMISDEQDLNVRSIYFDNDEWTPTGGKQYLDDLFIEFFVERQGSRMKQRPRRIRKQHDSIAYDPFQLVPPNDHGELHPAPFRVNIEESTLLVMDFHSHLSHTEIIGLLGGKYHPDQTLLEVSYAFPCQSVSTGYQCEMDPGSEVKAREAFEDRGLEIVGWYHSHPVFDPHPSIRDMENQGRYQDYLARPFIGIIVSPYKPGNGSNVSKLQFFWADTEFDPLGIYRLPYACLTEVVHPPTCPVELLSTQFADLLSEYRDHKDRVDMNSAWCNGGTSRLDHLIDSLSSHFGIEGEPAQLFLTEIRCLIEQDFTPLKHEAFDNSMLADLKEDEDNKFQVSSSRRIVPRTSGKTYDPKMFEARVEEERRNDAAKAKLRLGKKRLPSPDPAFADTTTEYYEEDQGQTFINTAQADGTASQSIVDQLPVTSEIKLEEGGGNLEQKIQIDIEMKNEDVVKSESSLQI
ncbi:10135_t:CDS:10 [Ambispora gerdemannii]|uniref:Ubiquinone biosynthesis protein n=1 Tax=Ambispora gerdemannii TaxID=144530 RepID=A0A9N8V514_9GLOM|nr:10135_t:CDS:10 [Ambispora gerdemannii]